MIIDKCDVVFENKEITQKVTLPCDDLIGTNETCVQGDLISGMCQFEVCPDGFTDNGSNCKKEVPPTTTPCVGVLGAYIQRCYASGNSFGSSVLFYGCNGANVPPVNQISSFAGVGTGNTARPHEGSILTFYINGVEYNEVIQGVSNDNGFIYMRDDIFITSYPNDRFTSPNQCLNGRSANPSDGKLKISKIIFKGVEWNDPNTSSSGTITCPSGTTLIDSKCYETTNKIQSQEVPVTNTTVTKQKALSQTVVVKKGETKSNISERHAQQLAKDLLNQKISLLQPKCEPIPLFYNTLQTKTAKKNCTTGTPCDITITVNARQFTSTESQEIADNLAKSEVERLFGLSTPCCIPDVVVDYLSDSKEYLYSKSCSTEELIVISPRGGNTVFRGITIPSFVSTISQQDANQKRDNWFIANKVLFENLIICPTVDCEGLTIIKTTQKLSLRINGVNWSLERFDAGSFIDDFNELISEVNNISSYKIKYCTLVPVYAGVAGNITDSTGVNIVSIDKNIITYSYITGSPTFSNGEYQVTIKLQGNKSGASKIFKYGSDNCC